LENREALLRYSVSGLNRFGKLTTGKLSSYKNKAKLTLCRYNKKFGGPDESGLKEGSIN